MKKYNTSLISSPFLDWKILQLLRAYGTEFDPQAAFKYRGKKTSLHELLGNLPLDFYETIPTAHTLFAWDSVIGDSNAAKAFEAFRKKNDFSLDIPIPNPSTEQDIFLTVAAIMRFIMQWPSRHKAEKEEYTISETDSFTGKEIEVKGFELCKMFMATVGKKTVGAELSVDGFSIQFYELDAFSNGIDLLRDHDGTFNSLYGLEFDSKLRWRHHEETSYVDCPCIDVDMHIDNHLEGIELINDIATPTTSSVQKIAITSSESLGKLELSEWGVKAKVETRASAHMLLGASIDHFRDSPGPLIIRRGLVFMISHKGKQILCAYVPQEEFKTV